MASELPLKHYIFNQQQKTNEAEANKCHAFVNAFPVRCNLKKSYGRFLYSMEISEYFKKANQTFVCVPSSLCPGLSFIVCRPAQKIEKKDLQLVTGSISQIAIDEPSQENFVTIILNEFPTKKFTFNKAGKTHTDLNRIRKEDLVGILAVTATTDTNNAIFSSFELRSGNTVFFSLEEHNSEISERKTLAKIFLGIAIILLSIYVLVERTGLLKWAYSKLSSPDKDFQHEKPNFNEFLDRQFCSQAYLVFALPCCDSSTCSMLLFCSLPSVLNSTPCKPTSHF